MALAIAGPAGIGFRIQDCDRRLSCKRECGGGAADRAAPGDRSGGTSARNGPPTVAGALGTSWVPPLNG